jgi:sporulation related protein
MKLLLILVFVYNGLAYAQDSSLYRDPRVDSLIKKQIQINEMTTRDSRRNVPGYRIQVANSNDRNQVFAIKTKIYQQYPELKSYLIYQPPNYKLKVGNFKTPEEAESYLQKLTQDFPSGVYLVHDIIDVKPD